MLININASSQCVPIRSGVNFEPNRLKHLVDAVYGLIQAAFDGGQWKKKEDVSQTLSGLVSDW